MRENYQNKNGVEYDVDDPFRFYAEDVIEIVQAIKAIQLALGTGVKGSFADATARLQDIEQRITNLE